MGLRQGWGSRKQNFGRQAAGQTQQYCHSCMLHCTAQLCPSLLPHRHGVEQHGKVAPTASRHLKPAAEAGGGWARVQSQRSPGTPTVLLKLSSLKSRVPVAHQTRDGGTKWVVAGMPEVPAMLLLLPPAARWPPSRSRKPAWAVSGPSCSSRTGPPRDRLPMTPAGGGWIRHALGVCSGWWQPCAEDRCVCWARLVGVPRA